jgi:TP901 family phage tail tape measure protein
MADLQKTVEIIFGGKNELSGAIGTIESDFAKFDASARKMAEPLASAAGYVAKMDAALIALVVGGMALAIRESSEFNKSFALISTSVDASGKDLEKYRGDVLNYATTSVKSMADINGALYTAAQAGIKWTDSLDFMRKSEELAVANNANLNTTVDLLTGTMNAYGYQVEDVGHLNDVFFTSTLIGKQTIDQLGQSMGNVVGIAAGFGVSFEQLSAAISTLTAKGMETAEAITAVKGVITTFVSPSKEAAAAAESMGLNFSASSLKAKGFEGMLADVMKATGGSADKMAILFSEVRALNGAMQLTGDGMKFFNYAMDEVNKSAGSSAGAYEKMVNTFSNQSQMLANTAKALMVSIGTELEPMAARISGSFSDLFKGIKVSVDAGAFDSLFLYLDEISKDISKWGEAAAESLPEALSNVDFSKLIDALQGISESIGDLFSGSSEGEVFQKVFQKVIDSITTLINLTAGMGQVFTPFIMVIDGAVEAFNRLDNGTQQSIGNLMALGVLYKSFGPLSIAILALGLDMETTQKILNVATSSIENGINTIKVAVYTLALSFALAAEAAANMLDYIPGYDAQEDIDRTSSRVKVLSQGLDDAQKALAASSQKTRDAFAGQGEAVETIKRKIADYKQNIDGLPTEKTSKVDVINQADATQKIETLKKGIDAVPDLKKVTVGVQADGSTIEKAYGMIITTFPDGSSRIVQAKTQTDTGNLSDTAKKIDDAVPAVKLVEIQAKLDETKIKASADIIQKSIEWKAKLDIANVEANAKIIDSIFDSIDNTITSTGNTLASFVSSLAGMQGGERNYGDIKKMSEEEMQIRRETFELQKQMTEAEIEAVKSRTQATQRGDAMIKIDGAGLQPHLEAFMFEVLSAIQIRANAEGQKFLVGI